MSPSNNPSWVTDIQTYCDEFNIPIEYLCQTLREPKVIPMIRGKAFEFAVMVALQRILPSQIWRVSKDRVNAQSGLHDVDVELTHLPTGKKLNAECKLARNKGYRNKNSEDSIEVKCMRSRTLGETMILQRAPRLGISIELLSAHNDQYLPVDFDVVVTSIGNSFYKTDENGNFTWAPSEKELDFLRRLFRNSALSTSAMKKMAFEQMYFASSKDIAVRAEHLTCTKKKCPDKNNCGFIPNYPKIIFDEEMNPINGWHLLETAPEMFLEYLN